MLTMADTTAGSGETVPDANDVLSFIRAITDLNAPKEKFAIDLKLWIKQGLIKPAVNGLRYTDYEGKIHRASVLPTGSVQDNQPGGKIYRTVRSWLASFVDLGRGETTAWRNELKRVRYQDISMWRLFCVSKSDSGIVRSTQPSLDSVYPSLQLTSSQASTIASSQSSLDSGYLSLQSTVSQASIIADSQSCPESACQSLQTTVSEASIIGSTAIQESTDPDSEPGASRTSISDLFL